MSSFCAFGALTWDSLYGLVSVAFFGIDWEIGLKEGMGTDDMCFFGIYIGFIGFSPLSI
jgi:hypothetical protein